MVSLMKILEVDIENYDLTKDPTNIDEQNTDWTIYDIDLKNIQEMKKNTTKSRKRKQLPKAEQEIE